ncbi:hypothetical protein NQ318_011116 [Aromia moschata]|uniref:DUF4817 domain-containing protein n=1 Tax=Aromia moschata TaxID=1265417 RepID=A0AAV8YSN9_9CUCU|nr:hypothetical protein NQ318_011116 [Aromia moschata]
MLNPNFIFLKSNSGCGDETRTQKQVCEIFNTKYPDRHISQSTVSRIENKFREFGNVTDILKSGRKRILDDEQKLDILLDIQDNPRKPTRQGAADNDVTKTSILRLLKNEKYRPYKIHLVQENPHWMMESNNQYPEKVNVWTGIINSQIIGPYFFDVRNVFVPVPPLVTWIR